jgi:hypothetical protein
MSSLSTSATLEYYDDLAKALPSPIPDTPELRHRRLSTAIEAFRDLHPGNAYEGRLAVRIVLCGAHAVECMLEASIYREDFSKRSRCRAQASSFQREERAAIQILVREQKERVKLEAVMGTARPLPAVAAVPAPSAERQATPSRPAVTPAAPEPEAAGSVPPPSPEAIAQAEDFAVEQCVAAAQIRHDRGVTPQNAAHFHEVTFPVDPAVIDALVRGTSALLTGLDDIGGEMLVEAA